MGMIRLENEWVSLGFDAEGGALTEIVNNKSGCAFISATGDSDGPFAVYHDFHAPFCFPHKPRSTPYHPVHPRDIATKVFRANGSSASFARSGSAGEPCLVITYNDPASSLKAIVTVTLRDTQVRWQFTLHNTGREPIEVMSVFPVLGSLELRHRTTAPAAAGSGRDDVQDADRDTIQDSGTRPAEHVMVVANSQAGYVTPLWTYEGGIYGNGHQMSMQWTCLFDRETKDSLGLIVYDTEVLNKQILYEKPTLQVRYFPPLALAAGGAQTLPEAGLEVYTGSWKKMAVTYRNWYLAHFPVTEMPQWLRDVDAYMGGWTFKHGKPYPGFADNTQSTIMTCMDSFAELDRHFRQTPIDMVEFAFFAEQCSQVVEIDDQRLMPHTDGVNRPRSDLGGAAALQEGVRRAQALGHRVTLYVEGFIVPSYGPLFREIPEAMDWRVQHVDGLLDGGYAHQHFEHMCPGCRAWQDFLADRCASLVRDTGVDGIRLDSLGYYFFPCYNPAHHHESPFDYNRWMDQLLGRVAAAIKAVNPDCFLSTEAPLDLYSRHCNSAYSSQYSFPRHNISVEDTAPMRIVLPEYRVFLIGGGPVAAAMLGLPGGNVGREAGSDLVDWEDKWAAVRYAAREIIDFGRADTENPAASHAEITCRRYAGATADVIVGSRPLNWVDPDAFTPGTHNASQRNDKVNIKRGRLKYTVTGATDGRQARHVWLYDVDRQSVSAIPFQSDTGKVSFAPDCNWFMAIIAYGEDRVPAILDLPLVLNASSLVKITLDTFGAGRFDGALSAPGLGIGTADTPQALKVPGVYSLTVPADTLPGFYPVRLQGDGLYAARRLVEVV